MSLMLMTDPIVIPIWKDSNSKLIDLVVLLSQSAAWKDIAAKFEMTVGIRDKTGSRMKVVASYLLALLSGNTSPSVDSVRRKPRDSNAAKPFRTMVQPTFQSRERRMTK
ncbi:hypothetical protein L1987_09513 [Smallanthus sonchifolius]|uniref:Uncharacterized protein n=1 Tax=Smallanthus sonchifolius TaxID=185202 RepID=A0ACB9JPV1_9ASTR|nr:hypothetical protein L1987_09513 [Smallanthus sonchifolius]